MIVLEALYLEERMELSYRLPLRIAFFLEDEYLKRNNVFQLIREAYKIRSKMVHDGIPLPEQVKINNSTMPRKRFVDDISNVVYRTIYKIISNFDPKFPLKSEEWDKIILSG